MNFGLIGKSLVHSFSKRYFEEKFAAEKLNHRYLNCELPEVEQFPELLEDRDWHGFNVTIPYKERILKYVDERSQAVEAIGAANTLQLKGGKIIAHNTDHIGFKLSLEELDWQPSLKRALILGNGGAAKAVQYALMGMDYKVDLAGRREEEGLLKFSQAQSLIKHYDLVVNTTPVGTYPNVNDLAPIRPEGRLEGKLFYDLIYNPKKTAWLALAEQRGAHICNGQAMLIAQAEAAWQIWQSA